LSSHSTSELIGAIRELARGRIEDNQCAKMLDEVRGHLDAGIQARIEMGMALEAAEEEAVLGFGDPREFVQKMAGRHPIQRYEFFDRKSLVAMLCALAFASLFTALDRVYGSFGLLPSVFYVLGLIGFIVWIAVTSWRAKLLPVLPLLTTLLIGIPMLSTFEAFGWMPGARYRVEAEKEFVNSQADFYAALKAESDFTSTANIAFFDARDLPPMKIIWRRSPDNGPDTYQLVPAASRAEANQSWQKTLPKAYAALQNERESAGQRMAFVSEELDQSFTQHVISGIPWAAAESPAFALCIFYVSALSWLSSYFWRTFKRRSRPRGLA